MRNPRQGTSVVLHDTMCSVYSVAVAQHLLIEKCVGLWIGSGETLNLERPWRDLAMIFNLLGL